MLSLRSGRRIALAAIAAALTVAATTIPAFAQQAFSLWPGDWFAPQTPNGAEPAALINITPRLKPGQIIASFTDRRLYYIYARGRAISYPIATPRPQSRWQGVMRISQKRVNPTWTPTPSMRAENPNLPAYVPGGHPKKPLGNRTLYLGSSLYRIHGTDAPWTIGQPVSKGCIRMLNQDVADLYRRVGVGTKVTVTWKSLYYS